jgi:hypothetical protein
MSPEDKLKQKKGQKCHISTFSSSSSSRGPSFAGEGAFSESGSSTPAHQKSRSPSPMVQCPTYDPVTRQTFGFGTGEETIFQKGARLAQRETVSNGAVPPKFQRSSISSEEPSPQKIDTDSTENPESPNSADSVSNGSTTARVFHHPTPYCSMEPSTSSASSNGRPSGAAKRKKKRKRNLPSKEADPTGAHPEQGCPPSASGNRGTPEAPESPSATCAWVPNQSPPSLSSRANLNRQSPVSTDHPNLLRHNERQGSVSGTMASEGSVYQRRRGSGSGTARGGDGSELSRGLPPAATVPAFEKPIGSPDSQPAKTTHATRSTQQQSGRSRSNATPSKQSSRKPKTRSQTREERGESAPPPRLPAHFVPWEDVGEIASELDMTVSE